MGSTPRKIRTAIVGLGFGAEFIPIHQRHPHVELVAICQRSRDKLAELGKQIAMHVAAAKPEFLDTSSADTSTLDREKAIYRDQAIAAGKAPDIIEKMLVGRVRKYYEEVVLLEQAYIMDDKMKVGAVVEKVAKELGVPVKLSGFVRFGLGEGIEKKESDFAAEVAAAAGTR